MNHHLKRKKNYGKNQLTFYSKYYCNVDLNCKSYKTTSNKNFVNLEQKSPEIKI